MTCSSNILGAPMCHFLTYVYAVLNGGLLCVVVCSVRRLRASVGARFVAPDDSKYIRNLDAKNLSLGIWGGDVVLRDLEVADDALRGLNLPIAVKHGAVARCLFCRRAVVCCCGRARCRRD